MVKAVDNKDYYLTPKQHLDEAERLAWVIDDVLQTDAERTLADLVAIARLHLDLALFRQARGAVASLGGESE